MIGKAFYSGRKRLSGNLVRLHQQVIQSEIYIYLYIYLHFLYMYFNVEINFIYI